jgi:ribonuclease Y
MVTLVAVVIVAGGLLGRLAVRRQAEAFLIGARRVVEAMKTATSTERAEILWTAEAAAREEVRAQVAAFEDWRKLKETELASSEERLLRRRDALTDQAAQLAERRARAAAAREAIAKQEAQAQVVREEAGKTEGERRSALQRRAGESAGDLRVRIIESELEDARMAAAHLLRSVEQEGADPEQARRAKRIMGIAVGRFSGHYLTERLLSNIPLPYGAQAEALIGREEANLRAIESVAGVKLSLSDARDSLRLEGLDGVGREIARRCINWLSRSPRGLTDPAAVTRTAREIAATLDRELADLGRRAFATLEIPPSHREIVNLVGRLNYRTSFTQNQWKHAIEAAFLCGMMAEEMGLDLKLARRAALMHDIGKALTHELDGSHAVIGADYARRLGEPEVVANAIGAHHTDEPFNSAYAYLVAAADAMSGARPGARRQMEDNYVAKLDELERITRSFRGVEESFAVQGGREVRIYVQEDRIDDLAAVNLSSEVAQKISKEMTFPGQIRVTVIREFKATETAN